MKLRTPHLMLVGGAALMVPLIAAGWIAWRELGSLEAWRPWLLLSGWGRLGAAEWWMALQVGVVGAVALLALGLHFFGGLLLGIGTSDLHGSSHWADRRALERASLLAGWGVVLGRFGEGRRSEVLRTNAPDYANVLLSAPPRAGKGVGVLVPTLLTYPGSLIVNDMKGELFELTARARAARRDRLRVFCPFDVELEGGQRIEGRSHGFNPLIAIKADPDLENRTTEIDVLARALLSPLAPGRDEGLLSSGREIFKAACAIVVAEEETPTLGRVVDILTPEIRDGEKLADMQSHLAILSDRAPDPASHNVLRSASANDNKNLALYMTVLGDAGLNAFRDPHIRRATTANEIDLDALRAVPTSIFLIVPDGYKETCAPVVRLLMQLAIKTLMKRRPGPDEQLPVLFAIDEFHSLGKMDVMVQAPTVLPGFGGRMITVIQSPASLDAIYGAAAARVFLDVCQAKVFMGANDAQTA